MNPQAYFTAHESDRNLFITQNGGDITSLRPVGEDWSSRRYFRVMRTDGRTAIIMETLPDSLGGGGPGHRLPDFIRISDYLRAQGVHTPEAYASNAEQGYAMIEDMGETSFRDVITNPLHQTELYTLATDVLIHLRQKLKPRDIDLPDYFDTHIHRARARVVDWYLPAARRQRNGDGLREEYLVLLDKIQRQLPPCPDGFVHGDFHPGNLMWCANETDLQRCGLLDFQGGMWGPVVYDLVNLLGDAQGNVSADICASMLSRYLNDFPASERQAALAWFRLLSLHFHGRVIGQIIKLGLRSKKTHMMIHLPRLQAYMRAAMAEEMFKPIATWFTGQGVDFYETINLVGLDGFIREDAF